MKIKTEKEVLRAMAKRRSNSLLFASPFINGIKGIDRGLARVPARRNIVKKNLETAPDQIPKKRRIRSTRRIEIGAGIRIEAEVLTGKGIEVLQRIKKLRSKRKRKMRTWKKGKGSILNKLRSSLRKRVPIICFANCLKPSLERLAEEAKRDDLTILILQLSLKTDERDIYTFLQKVIWMHYWIVNYLMQGDCGSIRDIRIIKDPRSGKSKG